MRDDGLELETGSWISGWRCLRCGGRRRRFGSRGRGRNGGRSWCNSHYGCCRGRGGCRVTSGFSDRLGFIRLRGSRGGHCRAGYRGRGFVGF